MATVPLGADFARENPEHRWTTACAMLDMASTDLDKSDDSDEEIDFYTNVKFHALDKLMMTPAPDAAAFARKLAIFFSEECGHFFPEYSKPMDAALLVDAERLAAEARHGGAGPD
jgi:hypothetical protein